jgi:hypothetical protein
MITVETCVGKPRLSAPCCVGAVAHLLPGSVQPGRSQAHLPSCFVHFRFNKIVGPKEKVTRTVLNGPCWVSGPTGLACPASLKFFKNVYF